MSLFNRKQDYSKIVQKHFKTFSKVISSKKYFDAIRKLYTSSLRIKKNQNTVCPVCGKEFIKHTWNNVFCSTVCSIIYRELKKLF